MAGAACATTQRQDCAYHEHRARTDDGRVVWPLFLDNAWRVQVAGMGYVGGVDTSRARARLVAMGMGMDVAEDLLAACEVGFVKAANEKDDDDGNKEP